MGMLPGEKEAIRLTAEGLAESADNDPYSRWIGGVIFPIAPLVAGMFYGARTLLSVVKFGIDNAAARRESLGLLAVTLLLLSVAGFLHAHYFWTPHPRWHLLGWLGKNITALVIVIVLLLAVMHGFVGIF